MLPSIHLHHLRNVKGVYPGKWICGNQHNSTVCINFLLGVAQFDGLENYRPISLGLYIILTEKGPTNQLVHSDGTDW